MNASPGDGIGPTGRSVGETPAGDVTLGSGGCTAVALSKIGVFTSVEETKAKLDAQIPIYSSMVREDLRKPEFVGVPGDRWHPDVVKRAVIDAGWHWRKLKLSEVSLATELKEGMYLVDGVLNDSFVKRVRGKEERFNTDESDPTDPRQNEAGWRHCFAVEDGRILEKEFEMSTDWLWLKDNKPDPDKGYFYKVLKVYRITRCTGGDCCPAKRRKLLCAKTATSVMTDAILRVKSGMEMSSANAELTALQSAIETVQRIVTQECEKADDDPFHSVGYEVYKNAIPVDPDIHSAILKSPFEAKGLPNSPDGNGGLIREAERQQTKSSGHKWCKVLREQQRDVLREHGRLATSDGGEKDVVKMYALKSLPREGYDDTALDRQPGDQGEHMDEPFEQVSQMKDVDKPLSTIYALEHGTRLRIRPFGGDWTIVHLEPGDLLVFRGDVCHHGMGYAKQNVRVHAYVYPPRYAGFKRPSGLNPCL